MGMNVGPGSGSSEPEVMMDINTTPLIDVMLVLLIMLIITIPSQLHSVNLDMTVNTNAAKKSEPVVIKVNIEENNAINWNGKVLGSRAELAQAVADAAAMNPQPEVHIRSHAKAKYDAAAAVMAAAQRGGLVKLGIVGSEQFAN